ncbi:lactonase family protein [Flavobacterium sp. PLA-1-15]|uniref:lactonase family protein n=1 Tax=Flavobacterium sp. PLA-1-15 TaxID=3380533 RepID=UPI003B7A6445
MQKLLSLFFLLFSIAMLSQTYVFLGSYNGDKSKPGIYVYELDATTGELKPFIEVKDVFNPSYVTLSPDGKFLYACTDTRVPNGGSFSSYAFSSKEKKLTFLNSQPSGGENPAYVSVHKNGKWLIGANYNGGSISVFPLSDDGRIGTISQNMHFTEGSINPKRQERSHPHSAIFSLDDRFVYFPDLGSDKIRNYRFEQDKKEPLVPTEISIKTKPGSGPRHFTFHPNGRFGYSIEELSGNVSVYQYEAGNLKNIQEIAAHPENLTDNFESADIHISPDGKFLYASNRGTENNIAIFSILNDGTLKNVGYQSTMGNHPRTFAIDPSGNFLIVTNVKTSDVVVFKRDFQTGMLQQVGQNLKVDNVSCVQIKSY